MASVLVTGMTSSQTREGDTIAGYIAHGLRMAGHTVTVEKPSLRAQLSGERYDHVFVGLGPLHGIGTSSMYGALATIGTHWGKSCSVFLDDTDTGKIGSSLRLFHRDKWRMTKKFYQYKREYDLAAEPSVVSWLNSVVESLLFERDGHPSCVVPSFSFDDAFKIASKITSGAAWNAKIVDFTPFAPKLDDVINPALEQYGNAIETPDSSWWAVEWLAKDNAHVRALGPFAWEVVTVGVKEGGILGDCSGYLAPTATWSPRFIQMTEAGIPIVSPWRIFGDIVGPSFEHLAQEVEMMTPRQRRALAKRQYRDLKSHVPTADEVASLLDSMVDQPPVDKSKVKRKKKAEAAT